MPVLVSRRSDDVVVRLNDEYTAAYGVMPEAAKGQPARRLHFVEEDRDATLSHHEAGKLESVEVRISGADGVCMWAQADVSIFEYEGESVYLTTLYDISARKQAERELEDRGNLIAEMARFPAMNPGPVARLTIDGNVLRSNQAANDFFEVESLSGTCFWDLIPQIDGAVRAQIVDGVEPVHLQVPVGERWLGLTLRHDPESDQIFVYGTDITGQKDAEAELADRARFPQMNPGPVARLRSDGTVLRANPAARHVFDVPKLAGLSFLELVGNIDDALWRRILEGGRPVQHESQIDGRTYSYTLIHEPTSDQVFLYGSDVSELKAAEQALTELARFPDMNPGPVLRLDHQGEVLLANPAANRIFGAETLTGMSWFALCPNVDQDFWSRVHASDEPLLLEAQIGDRHFVLHHTPGPNGLFVFVFGSDITDEKKAEQALLQSDKMATLGTLAAGVAHELNNPAAAAQRAAEHLETVFVSLQRSQVAIRALDLTPAHEELLAQLDEQARDAAGCPCELDPLARSDLEYELEQWLDEQGSSEPWELAPALTEMEYSVEQLEGLGARGAGAHAVAMLTLQAQAHGVYRLLEEIRLGSGRLVEIVGAMKAYAYLGDAPVQNIDVNEGLQSTLVILRSKLKLGVTVTLELDPELPRIQAYGSELNQVWTNLLDNAAGAMGGEGHITIRTRVRGENVVVDIEDDGPGIPFEVQAQVFDAFFTTKPPGEGTGLGLNTSYNIVVEKHSGSIELDSEPGRTCFSVSLPIQGPDAP